MVKTNTKELQKQLKEKKEEVAVLYRISDIISTVANLDELLGKILEVASEITKSDACHLFLFDEAKEHLVLRAAKPLHPKTLGLVRLNIGEGIAGIAAKQKKILAINKEAMKDPRYKFFQGLPEDKFQAILSVPIIAKNEVIGVVNIRHRSAHRYSDREKNLVAVIGTQVGSAIEKTRLYEESRKKSRRLDTMSRISTTIASGRYLNEILQLVVTMTAEMMNSKICSIMLLDDKKQELEIKATQSLSPDYIKKPNVKVGESVSGQAVKEKKPVTVLNVTREPAYKYPDIARKEGIVSMLSVPMMIKDKVVGVINSYTSHEHSFSEEEVKILQSVANQAAIAIENTKLFDKTMEMEEALETRKVVEKAKGILMQKYTMNEAEAFKIIQQQSMNTRKSMKQIAEAILLTAEMNK